MENASKAIIMAGGILIAIIIMSLLVMLFSQIGSVYSEEGSSKAIEQLEEYNKKFALYDRSLYGSELLSLANLIKEYEESLVDGSIDLSGSTITANKINVTVEINNDVKNQLEYGSIKIPNNKIETLKTYSEKMERKMQELKKSGNQEEYDIAKTCITQLKSMPFRCSDVGYKNGRISTMKYTIIWDQYIDDVIHNM